MDPVTAMLLAGVLSLVFVKTAGSAVTDVAAQAKGNTPPSLEKWRSRNQQRKAAGQAGRAEPGAWRRRFQNAMDQHHDRADQRAKARHDGQMQHLQDTHPARAEAARAKQQRKRERQQRVRAATARVGGVAAEGVRTAVSPEHRRERAAWAENQTRDQQSSAPDAAAFDPATGELPTGDTPTETEHDEPTYPTTQQPQPEAIDLDRNDTATQQEESVVTTANSAGMHSGEITNLTEATAFARSAVSYCDQISGTFEDAKAQASATSQDVAQMAATVENAQSSLAGEGLNEAAGQLASVEEQLTTLMHNMAQVETLLSGTEEAIASARATLDSAGQTFQQQQGIAEEMSAHREVATNSRFYQEA